MISPVICIGESLVDELFHSKNELLPATTNDAIVTKSAGGVSRNIAHHLALLGLPVQLITVFGNDSDGDRLKEACVSAGVKLDAAITSGITGKYTGILNPDGSLHVAFIMKSDNHLITAARLEQQSGLLRDAAFMIVDANVNVPAFEWLLDFSNQNTIPMILEPVSVPPAKKYRDTDLNGLYLITPNEDELPALCSDSSTSTQQQVDELLERGVQHIWLHYGPNGSTFYSREKTITLGAPKINIVDCTGAGDGSLAGFIFGKYLGEDDPGSLKLAHVLSAEILGVSGSVATHINRELLLNSITKYFPIE
jgi:pseudouridine kinase